MKLPKSFPQSRPKYLLYAWNTLNAAFHNRLEGETRDVQNLCVTCDNVLIANKMCNPISSAFGGNK